MASLRYADRRISLSVQGITAYLTSMSTRRPAILLTGFGPFPGVPKNISGMLVPELASAARKRWPRYHFEAAVLPTEWLAGPAAVAILVDELKPALALHFGVANSARGFAIESRGHNSAKPVSDAAGLLPPSSRLSPDGPEYLSASIPAAKIVERLRRRSLPAGLSHDAGGYLCNAVLYGSLERARKATWSMRSGFVHLPTTLDAARTESPAAALMDWEQAAEGSLEILATALGETSLSSDVS